MGLLDSFERGLERAVNGAFAKTFRSGVQPVEIAAALRAELDAKASVVSRDRILVPSTLTVRLSDTDAAAMADLGPGLVGELTEIVRVHAASQHYSFAGPVSVTLARDESLPTGRLVVDAHTDEAAVVTWQAVLEVQGIRHPLRNGRTVVGRGSDADITLPDAGTSRHHMEVLWNGERAVVRDLGSTNGTRLDGRRVSEAPLPPDSVVSIGRTDMVFRVVPTSRSAARPARPRTDAGAEAARRARGGDRR